MQKNEKGTSSEQAERKRSLTSNVLKDQNSFVMHDDPLLTCLVFLSSHYGKAKSAESLKAGLSWDSQGMGPDLFCEAADKIGMNAKIVLQKSLSAIPEVILPCVLILKNSQICLLLERNTQNKVAKVFIPETKTIANLQIDLLSQDFSGYAIYIHPRTEFLSQNQPPEEYSPDHWFWGGVIKNITLYTLVILTSIFINIFALVSPLFVMNIYDRVIPNNAIETGWALGIGALVAFVFDFIFRTVRGYLIDFAGRKADILAARRIYDQLLNIKLSGKPPSSGAFANMLREFDSVRDFFTSATIATLVDLPFTLIFLLMILQLSGSLVFVPVVLMITAFILGYFIQRLLKRNVLQAAHTSETKHSIIVETIYGLETIKSSNADGRFRARFSNAVFENAEQGRKSRLLSALGVNIAIFFQQAASAIMILFGMYMVQAGMLSVGGLIASVILGGRAIAPIGQVANLMTRYHQASSALKSLETFMNKEVERPKGNQFLHRPDLKGKITFEKVSFFYPHTKNLVLDNVSFEIKEGEKVGIIGRIGSGKSTLIKLMMKIYEPQSGTILVDDTDYRQIDPADLRRSTAYVAQDVVLFNSTVRDNITSGLPQATEQQLLRIAKATGVHEFISRHPMGYDAPVGELGQSLSGGQRQSIALARAMISNPNILICDEPTNAMDLQAEQVFIDYISEQAKTKTLILVTHKQTMLNLVDRLILMHQGKLIMDGPRDEVLEALTTGTIKTNNRMQ